MSFMLCKSCILFKHYLVGIRSRVFGTSILYLFHPGHAACPNNQYIHFTIILSTQTPSINFPYSYFFFNENSILWFLSVGYIVLLGVTKLTVRKSEHKLQRTLFRNGSIYRREMSTFCYILVFSGLLYEASSIA